MWIFVGSLWAYTEWFGIGPFLCIGGLPETLASDLPFCLPDITGAKALLVMGLVIGTPSNGGHRAA